MNKDTCYNCYHIVLLEDKKTEMCDIDEQIINSKKTKRCSAYSTNENERVIG